MMVREAMFCGSFPRLTPTDADAWPPSSTKLDAEKRLALQEEKQSLETKLLEM